MKTNRELTIDAIRAGVSLREALPTKNHAPGCACLLCEWVPIIEEGLRLRGSDQFDAGPIRPFHPKSRDFEI